MIYLQLLFLAQCLLGILMICFLHRINQIKKQIDKITKEVEEYLTFIEEDTARDMAAKEEKILEKNAKDEVENHLIQSVLKEYFP